MLLLSTLVLALTSGGCAIYIAGLTPVQLVGAAKNSE